MTEMDANKQAEITQTIVRTAHSRLMLCLRAIQAQSPDASVIAINEDTKSILINTVLQDFSCAAHPSNGSASLTHGSEENKKADLELVSDFNNLQPNKQREIVSDAVKTMICNFNASPISKGVTFTI